MRELSTEVTPNRLATLARFRSAVSSGASLHEPLWQAYSGGFREHMQAGTAGGDQLQPRAISTTIANLTLDILLFSSPQTSYCLQERHSQAVRRYYCRKEREGDWNMAYGHDG